ncbi:unknown [Sutterella wadsworthensis CAG:135]|nr:unknown [Sutterella wadsworthensis CAG:135]
MPAALAGIVETDGITALYRFKSNCHLTIRITCAPILLFAGVFYGECLRRAYVPSESLSAPKALEEAVRLSGGSVTASWQSGS